MLGEPSSLAISAPRHVPSGARKASKAAPRLEPLEHRELLAGGGLNDVSMALSTDRPEYHRGQSIVMTLTETNTSQHDMTVYLGPSNDGFIATVGGEVWTSNPGPQPMWLVPKTIRPGKSITITVRWNGQANFNGSGPVTGHIVIRSELAGSPRTSIQLLSS